MSYNQARQQLTTVFMGLGIPVYYMTAHSRAKKVGSAYGSMSGETGLRATVRSESFEPAPMITLSGLDIVPR